VFEGEYALREMESYTGEGVSSKEIETLLTQILVMASYPFGIMVTHKNVCIRPCHPAEVIEVLQRRYAISKKRIPHGGGVAEPTVATMLDEALHLR
jgi:hypothetical protein